MTWKLAGTDARGAGFALSWTDRYFAGYDVSDEAGMALGDIVYRVASMPGVTLDSVTTAGQITKNATMFSVARLEARRNGAWSRVSYRRPLVARSGHSFTVRAVLRSTSGGVLTVPFTFAVPRRASGKMAMLAITGGASVRLNLGTSIASARKALGTAVRSDVLRAQFGRSVSGVDDYDDEDYRVAAHSRRSGPRIVRFTHTRKSAPHTAVIAGGAAAMVLIR
jgi:hypothetical protein